MAGNSLVPCHYEELHGRDMAISSNIYSTVTGDCCGLCPPNDIGLVVSLFIGNVVYGVIPHKSTPPVPCAEASSVPSREKARRSAGAGTEIVFRTFPVEESIR